MKATAAFVPAPLQQSVFAPIVSGISAAAASAGQVNWGAKGGPKRWNN
jgi:hypothetical protein